MKVDNPTELIMQKDAEIAARLDPTLQLYDTLVGLINESKKNNDVFDIKAKILKPTLISALKAKMSPVPQPLTPLDQKKPQTSETLPLFGGGGGARSPIPRNQQEPEMRQLTEQKDRAQMAQTNRQRRTTEGGLA